MNQINTTTAYELSKTLAVSQEKLFNALIDPVILKKIWGVQSIDVDARVGGKTNARFIIGGQNWSFTITYLEIIPNEKIRWNVHFESFPAKETRLTLFFRKKRDGTQFTLRMENFETSQERDENRKAWEGALTTLEQLLK